MTNKNLLDEVLKEKFITIFRGIPLEEAAPIAKALVAGGIKFIEITYNHKSQDPYGDFAAQFKAVKEAVGNQAYIGAGTVLSVEQVDFAYGLGAEYIVSPNTNKDVIKRTKDLQMVSIPGAMTPSEIVFAHDCGADVVKLYIVEDPGFVKYLMGPLGHIPVQATCNVDVETIPRFLDAGVKLFGTRAFIGNDLIANKNYAEIEKRARAHVEAIKAYYA